MKTLDLITKTLVLIFEVGYLFTMLIIMILGMISENMPIWGQLLICFIGVPAWIFIIGNFGKIYNLIFKD